MAHPANFIVADERGWRLHRTASGAGEICSLLVRGPLAVRRAVESLPRAEDPRRDWYGDTLAAGGALLDFTHRRLLFHGDDAGVYGDGEVRVLRELLRRIWRDWHWQVRWAYDGPGDLVAAVGLDRAVVRARVAHPAPDRTESDLSRPVHLLTVRHADGVLHAWPLGRDEHSGWQGPVLLDRLPAGGAERLDLGAVPASGTHVDVGERTVGVWTGSTCPGLLPALAGLWPGWRTEFWGDRHEQQLLTCEEAVTAPPFDAGAGLDGVLAHLPAGRGTPLRAGISRALGDDVEHGYRARDTARLRAGDPPSEDDDWYWAGRAAGGLLRDLRRRRAEPDAPPWMRPAPPLADFLRARLDELEEAAEGTARLEGNLRAWEYWFRTAAFQSPSPGYQEQVAHWPHWDVRDPRDGYRPHGPVPPPPAGATFPPPGPTAPPDPLVTVGRFHLAPPDFMGEPPGPMRRDARLAGTHLSHHSPARARADLDARRRVLDRYTRAASDVERLRAQGAPQAALTAARLRCHTLFLALRDLAAAFAHHPDHNPEWNLPAGTPYRA
ncbi:hypothetical protein AQ490_05700 [Wenjunlia vitaminophila]|uniref:Uncharacterized protein n=1 Tax=Wenjunlia vitaminophila TaxID=76728 RepID=A0A0T6LP12_WENVI|nr:DUF6221 family protein [Wenjunlia vitaminophila]KRV47853.1 hypothetical protein AQ490_05700 [Wenjunlia vitaminophila]